MPKLPSVKISPLDSIVTVIVAAIFIIGVKFDHQNPTSFISAAATTPPSVTKPALTPAATPTPSPQTSPNSSPLPSPGFKTYTTADFSFLYPASWQIKTTPLRLDELPLIGSPVGIWPGAANGPSLVTVLEFAADENYLKTFNISKHYPLTPNQFVIHVNGEKGYYTAEKTDTSTSVSYLVYRDLHAVEIDFQLVAPATASQPATANYQYQAIVDDIANSLKFK